MATKKNSTTGTTTKARKKKGERYAGYPYASAYEIQYEPEVDADGKPVYQLKRNSTEFRRDDKNKKIRALTSTPKRDKNNQIAKKRTAQLPWGFVVRDTGERKTWVEGRKNVVYAGCNRRRDGGFEKKVVWIREDTLQDDRCLEVVFVDIGQGDGCFLVTPDNKRMVIDAGQGDNMRHYLNWRHGPGKETKFECAVISHPDADHYKGFEKLFERPNFFFDTIYTNGLMERNVEKPKPGTTRKKRKPGEPVMTNVGPVQEIDGVKYVTELVTTKKDLERFLDVDKNWVTRETTRYFGPNDHQTSKADIQKKKKKAGKQFPTMLYDAFHGWKKITKRPRNGDKYILEYQETKGKHVGTMRDYRMLSAEDEYMPGYEPKEGRDLTIQVLGPVTKTIKNKKMLQWFDSSYSSSSKTKNGHSVVLRLQYRNVSILLGGDLNIPSENLLLSHHTGMVSPPDRQHEAAFIEASRRVFQVDIAKSCHHGSSDFTEFFLRALNPIATIISSGDNECHSHPRSDTLGTIGRHARSSPRPLIFSTELARSTKDNKQKPFEIRADLLDEIKDIIAEESQEKRDEMLNDFKRELEMQMPRSVAVYGAIHVVTDGNKAIIYQKLETKSASGSYDIYRLECSSKGGTSGPLMFKSKH